MENYSATLSGDISGVRSPGVALSAIITRAGIMPAFFMQLNRWRYEKHKAIRQSKDSRRVSDLLQVRESDQAW